MLLARRLRELYLMCMRAESRLGGTLTEVLLEVRRWGYRVLLEVSTEDTIERHEVYWSLKP